ncbi:MAG: indole-3-acetate monooxygenase [Thermoleophilaceae bacterium]|jgi:alkylation response protein AidB-like acyl-CoA dehydrogenase|nr:indole-3-acetate monooxygenase [Thermoleophilaceae bacterium]
MTETQVHTAPRDDELEAVARDASALARELAAETERRRALPDQLVARLRDSGLLRAGAPLEVEGLELAPGPALRCAEEVARGDASAGWCVSIAMTSSLLAAYLPAESRDELFGGGRGIAAGVWAPRGKARAVGGGIVVSGRWAFCSGIAHADLLFAGCMVEDEQLPRVVAFPTDDLDILDTWHTLGLRGTGSTDAVADEVFVPAPRVFSLFDGPVLDRPLYRFPVFGYFALSIAAAALGNARAAIEELVELAAGKVAQGSSRTLAQRTPVQASLAGAEASLRAARALYYDAIGAAWQAAQGDQPVPVELRTQLRLAATHAVRTSAEVVRSMYDLAGGSAIYDDSPLQRRFRDAHTATAHFQVNEASRELPGRILLDQPADPSML